MTTLCEADALLGDVAVACGYLTPERLRECVDLVETAFAYGVPASLRDLLRDKGYLTEAQCETAERAAEILAARREDRLYGAIAVKQGLATQAQVDGCLSEQQKRNVGDKPIVRLSDLLRENGCITRRQDLALWCAVEKAKREGPPPRVVRGGDAAPPAPLGAMPVPAVEGSEAVGRRDPGGEEAGPVAPVEGSPHETERRTWTQTVGRLRQRLGSDPYDLSTHLTLGEAYVRLGQPDEAVATYRAARRIAPSHRELAYRLCELLEGARDADGMLEVISDLRRYYPGDPEVERRYRGLTWTNQARRIAELRATLARNAEDPEAHLELAAILLERSERAEALKEFVEAGRCGASATRVLLPLECAVLADLSWAEGVAALRDVYVRALVPNRAVSLLEARARTDASPRAELELIELYVAVGQPHLALERMRTLLPRADVPQEALVVVAERVLEGNRMHAKAHRFLSELFGRRGDLARAAHHLKAYLCVEKSDLEAAAELAATLERLNDPHGAEVAWRSYVAERSDDLRAWRALARVSLAIDKLDGAREAARRAALLAPSDATSLELLRSVDERILDVEIARHLARLKVDPGKTQTRLALAECYRRRGKMEEARRQIELAATDADFTLASRATRLLVEQASYDPAGVPLVERLHRMEELREHLRRVTGDRLRARAGGADGPAPG